MATLTADATTVVINVNAGETHGSTSLHYHGEGNAVHMWTRWGGAGSTTLSPWQKVNLPAELPGVDHAARYGTLPIRVALGQIREFGLMSQAGQEPDDSDAPRFTHRLSIWGVAKYVGETGWISDGNTRVGGTFYEKDLILARPAAVRLALTPDPLPLDGDGRPVYPTRINDQDKFRLQERNTFRGEYINLAEQHLLPGNLHHVSIFLLDPSGAWSHERQEFTTHKRFVAVRFETIVVHEDSDFETIARIPGCFRQPVPHVRCGEFGDALPLGLRATCPAPSVR